MVIDPFLSIYCEAVRMIKSSKLHSGNKAALLLVNIFVNNICQGVDC